MKTRILLGLLSLILIVGIITAGCAKPAPAPAKPIELKMATHSPPFHYVNATVFPQWIQKVEERTNGRVKITLYPGQTLGKMPDEWNMLKTGVSDLGWILPMYYPGVFPLCDISDMPYIIPEGRPLSVVNSLFEKFLNKQFGEVKVLWPGILGNVRLHMVKKPVKTLEDLQGLQIRCPPGPLSETIKALGATPVMIPAPEAYTALERGMADGGVMPFEAWVAFKLFEVSDYHIVANLGAGFNVTAVNLETWNSLPPDIQKAIEELSPWAQELMREAANAADEEAISVIKGAGNEFIYLSPEEEAKWIEATKPVADAWAAKMGSQGMPGTAIVEEARRLAAAVK